VCVYVCVCVCVCVCCPCDECACELPAYPAFSCLQKCPSSKQFLRFELSPSLTSLYAQQPFRLHSAAVYALKYVIFFCIAA